MNKVFLIEVGKTDNEEGKTKNEEAIEDMGILWKVSVICCQQ